MTTYRHIEAAFLGELREIIECGGDVAVRGALTRECRARLIEIENVRERYLLIPGRNNNIFAAIAESMWVIAGRNDLEYIRPYLPRADEYSDDGQTWRAGYGPRLRNWNGVDQLSEVVSILRAETASRRAVATIFDPDRDFVDSKDIPCNNWLHFLLRDGHLDLHVAARSTDIWWGFSGINAFEWSLLLEMVAFWLGHEPGRLVFFTSSMHLYERHFGRARKIVAEYCPTAEANHAPRASVPHFATSWEDFAAELSEWMRVEKEMRSGGRLNERECALADPLLLSYARMIDLYWAFKRHENDLLIEQGLARLGDTYLRRSATEFIRRTNGGEH